MTGKIAIVVWSASLIGLGGAGIASCGVPQDDMAGEDVITVTSALTDNRCADGSVEQTFSGGMVGCAAPATWDNRRYLCGTGYRPVTAAEWVAFRGTTNPTHIYWTDDDLHKSGTGSSACAASLVSGFDCNGNPMRVCTSSGTDAEGNACSVTNCGLDTNAPNQFFGGCDANTTAGALCIPEGCADGSVDQTFPNGMVGCSGSASSASAAAPLCAPAYRVARIDEFNTLTRPEIRAPNTIKPSRNYWTTTTKVCPPAGCGTGTTAGAVCVPQRGCADGTAEQVMPDGLVGCGGTANWVNRDNQCARGYRTATAKEWAVRNQLGPEITPTHDYWTADDLKFNGSASSCWVSASDGSACAAGQPMRLCTPTGTDAEGNTCNWTNCGYNGAGSLRHFGGCNTSNTAGSLCVPQDILPTNIIHQEPRLVTLLNDARSNNSPPPPGMAIAVIIDNMIYLATVGKRKNTDTSNTVQETDKWQLNSVSKSISGAVATRAVDQGLLSWNSTLGTILPSVFQGTPAADQAYKGVRLDELYAHASGFDYDTTASSGCPATELACEPNPPADAANDYANTPLIADRKLLFTRDYVRDQIVFPHGTGFTYGTGAVPAISMIEQMLSATSYDALMQDYILRPLGMNQIATLPDVWGHSFNGTALGDPQPPAEGSGKLRLPVGGVATSIEDLARFAHAALYSPRAPWHLWSYQTQKSLLNGVGQSPWSAAGWFVSVNPRSGGVELWHNGSEGLNHSDVVVWPQRRVAYVLMENYDGSGGVPAASWAMARIEGVLSGSGGFGVPAVSFPYPEASSRGATARSFPSCSSSASGPTACASSVYASSPDFDASKAFDGDYTTRWAADGGATTNAELDVVLRTGKPVRHVIINEAGTFDAASGALSRYGPNGSRAPIQEFRVKSWQLFMTSNGHETMVASGTTLGANKLIEINNQTSVTKARLVMNSTNGPTIKEMQLLPW